MIIIVSEYQDAITDKVIEYLIFDNLFFIRINESETISDFNLYLCNNKLHIDFSTIRGKVKLSEIQFIWYRRGNISLNMSGYFIDDKIKNKSLMSVLNKDWEIFSLPYSIAQAINKC